MFIVLFFELFCKSEIFQNEKFRGKNLKFQKYWYFKKLSSYLENIVYMITK